MSLEKRDFMHNYEVKQYKLGEYKNPHKIRKQRRKVPKIFRYLLILSLPALIIFLIFFSGLFAINGIEITGVETYSTTAIENEVYVQLSKRRFLIFSQNNSIFLNEKELKTKIENLYAFESLEFEVKKHQIKIHLVERASELLWASDGRFMFIDLNGVIIRNINVEEEEQVKKHLGEIELEEGEVIKLAFPIVFDQSDESISVGDVLLDKDRVASIISLHTNLVQQGFSPYIYEIEKSDNNWISATIEKEYNAYFDLESNLARDASRLRAVVAEEIEDLTKIEYIDLRFGDHVYYK